MLTSLLLLTALCAPQDAASEPPAAAAPVAAPDRTPDSVRAFLGEAQALLYDPQAAGLESLAFDLPIEMPAPIGAVGYVHVAWAKGVEPTTTMVMTPGLELPPQVPVEALEAQAIQQGKQFLGNMLNRPIGSLLDTGVATMGGVRDGLVAVSYLAPDAASQGIVSQVYLFNDENQLQKQVAEIEAPGPMGEMKVNMTQSFSWKAAEGAEGKLVVATQSIDIDFGFMQQKSRATYNYRSLGSIMLPVQLATVTEMPAMMGGGTQEQLLEAKNLVVNGTAAADPAPAAAPTPPAGG